jgi:hypothetical protein
MSRSADPADVAAVREALKQILGAEHYELASPDVMNEVESIYQSLTGDGLSLSDPGFLLSVYRSLGELADAVEHGRTDRVHWAARFLAAKFLLIAELSLDTPRRGNAEHHDHNTGFSDEPPF